MPLLLLLHTKPLNQSTPPLQTVRRFYTEECRAGGERVGFDVVTLGGARSPLARAGGAAARVRAGQGSSAVQRVQLPSLAAECWLLNAGC